MAADAWLPAITLTDPHNKSRPPSPALSPLTPIVAPNSSNDVGIRGPFNRRSGLDYASGRPVSRASDGIESTWSGSDARSESANSRSSPSKLRISRFTNAPPPSSSAVNPSQATRAMENGMSDAQRAIDPLSSHIIKRTNISPAVSPHRGRPSTSDSLSLTTEDARGTRNRSPSAHRSQVQEAAHHDLKRGVKGVAFLSRLMGSNKKKAAVEQAHDNESVSSDVQPEGNEAQVFAQAFDNTNFSARHPPPPGYIKVRSKYKDKQDFNRLFLAQELHCSKRRKLVRTNSNKWRRKASTVGDADTVWAMEFSKDGTFLAAAGADTVVRVWQVLTSSDDRHTLERQESNDAPSGTAQTEHLSAPVFQSQPVREYEGHEATVLDLSWSKNNFLLSSSMDKTVRLWHMSRSECLCTFKHNDFVPSIAFHPKDDRFFLAGSLDSKLRLWSIPDKNVAYMASAPDMITAVAFMPDGKLAVVGTASGSCIWYETEGFKYKTQLQVRDRGQKGGARKITAIQTAHGRGGDKLLITSNDSKIRLYNLRDKSCELMFKGNENSSSQIRGSLSDDGRHVVCGSEDRKAYIWSIASTSESDKFDKRPVEYFEAHDSVTTAVCMAPSKTRRLLSESGDPVYELCTPPSAQLERERTDSRSSDKAPTETESVWNAPSEAEGKIDKNKGRPTHHHRVHKNGQIIVTADISGRIKIFRQDCAWSKRQRDDWDKSSVLVKRGDRSSLASSLATKASHRSLREARNAAMAQVASSDRIISWRQGIARSPNPTNEGSPKIKPQSRGDSPDKVTANATNQSDSHTRSDTNTSSSLPSTVPTSAASNEPPIPTSDPVTAAKPVFRNDQHTQPKIQDPLLLDGQRSYMFWEQTQWKDAAQRAHTMFSSPHQEQATAGGSETDQQTLSVDPLTRTVSYVSQLSDERSRAPSEKEERHDSDDDDDEFDDALEHH